jgi:hypothetical protein
LLINLHNRVSVGAEKFDDAARADGVQNFRTSECGEFREAGQSWNFPYKADQAIYQRERGDLVRGTKTSIFGSIRAKFTNIAE